MKVVPLVPEHLDLIEFRQSEVDRFQADPVGWNKVLSLARYGKGGAIVHDHKIIALIGYYEMWPGNVHIWAYPSAHVKDYAMMYLRTCKRYLNSIIQSHQPRRMESTALADDLHTRWMEFLGFRNETPNGMLNYSVLGETFNMWGWTPEYTEAEKDGS